MVRRNLKYLQRTMYNDFSLDKLVLRAMLHYICEYLHHGELLFARVDSLWHTSSRHVHG
jgi:hypothetical protein